MARKIICDLPNRKTNDDQTCSGVVAHQISPRMLQVARRDDQRVTIVGENWNATVTCPRCGRPHSFICKNGVIIEEGHKYEEIDTPPAPEPTDPPAPDDDATPPAGDPEPTDPPTEE